MFSYKTNATWQITLAANGINIATNVRVLTLLTSVSIKIANRSGDRTPHLTPAASEKQCESVGANGKSEVVLADYELIVRVTCRRQKNVQQVP